MSDYLLTTHGNRLARGGVPDPTNVKPMANGATAVDGCMVAADASGNARGTGFAGNPSWIILGVCARDVDNSSNLSLRVEIEEAPHWLDNDSTNPITEAMIERNYCFAVDNHTVGSSDLGGTLPTAGVPTQLGDGVTGPTGKVLVRFNQGTQNAANPNLANANSTAFKCRGVFTSLTASYTGSTTGQLTAASTGTYATQDGLTLALNDVFFIQEGTTNLQSAADAGPWQVTTLGATGVKAVFTRPDWWPHGGAIVPGIVIQIGGEGTGTDPCLAGTAWKSFAAKSKVIDTDAPVFWPDRVSCAVTLASGTLASARRTIPVRSHLATTFTISSDPATAPHASTRVWRVSALTDGVTGTASVQVVAESAPGTTNTSDVGQYTIAGTNW